MSEQKQWKLEIRRVGNGYILKGKFDNSDLETEQVIEVDDLDLNFLNHHNIHTMQKVLWDVMEYFGIYFNKHERKNLKVKITNEPN